MGGRNWTARQVGKFKPLIFLLLLYPLFRWVWLGLAGGLGANPPEFLIRSRRDSSVGAQGGAFRSSKVHSDCSTISFCIGPPQN